MNKRLQQIKDYRQTLMIVIVVTIMLALSSLVFQSKIKEVMDNDVKENFIKNSLNDVEIVNKSFSSIIDTMNSVANTLSDSYKFQSVFSTITALQSINKVTGFVNIGVIDIHGNNVYGPPIVKDVSQKLMSSFRGKPTVTVASSDSGGSYDVLIAVPVFQNNYIKYVVYVRASDEEIIGYLHRDSTFIKSDNIVMSYLVYNLTDVVYLNHSTDGRLLPHFTFNVLSKRYGLSNPSELQNTIEQNINEVYEYKVDRYPVHYMSIIPTQFEEWSFVTLIPVDVVDNKIRVIMGMFWVVAGSIISILMVLLLYYEYAVNTNRRKIHRLAYEDEVTDMPNKAMLREVFADFIKNDNKTLFLVRLELVNRTFITRLYGYEVAQKADAVAAANFKKNMDDDIFAAKVQDYYVILFKIKNIEEVKNFFKDLFKNIQNIPGVDYQAVYAVGITQCTKHSDNNIEDFEYYLDNCFIVLTQETLDTRHHSIKIYSPEMRKEIVRSEQIEHELIPALRKGEFLVYFQPKYDLKTNRLYGAEALIRWNYKFQGIRPPYQFIPVFERNGSIANIDNFVFDQVMKCIKKWKDKGYRQVPISVNCSQVQFLNPNLVSDLQNRIKGFEDVVPYIDIEITESATINDVKHVQEVLKQIKDIGFKISMDDFGTGYSSLSNLSLLPFDIIKIDKSFVDRIDVEQKQAPSVMLIKDVISIAHHFDILTLVEGVETIEQRDILKSLGCEYCQGYYYSKPLPESEFEKLLSLDSVFIDYTGDKK